MYVILYYDEDRVCNLCIKNLIFNKIAEMYLSFL